MGVRQEGFLAVWVAAKLPTSQVWRKQLRMPPAWMLRHETSPEGWVLPLFRERPHALIINVQDFELADVQSLVTSGGHFWHEMALILIDPQADATRLDSWLEAGVREVLTNPDEVPTRLYYMLLQIESRLQLLHEVAAAGRVLVPKPQLVPPITLHDHMLEVIRAYMQHYQFEIRTVSQVLRVSKSTLYRLLHENREYLGWTYGDKPKSLRRKRNKDDPR
jgi:hypothetical protein